MHQSGESPMRPLSRAVLLDRDGTLIEDPGYLSRPEELVWKNGVPAALRRLQDAGFLLILATNQSGIGRGLYTLADMERVNDRIRDDLARAGVTLAAIYYCPHRPQDGCDCRKPAAGMLLQAAREHGLDPGHSWMIGDKCSDVEAGTRAGMRTVLVYSDAPCTPTPHLRAANFSAAVDLILER